MLATLSATTLDNLPRTMRAVLEPPYINNRPLIKDDGVSVVRPHRD